MRCFKKLVISLFLILSVDKSLNVISSTRGNSLKYQDSSIGLISLQLLSDIFQLFDSSSVFCLFSDDEELNHVFTKLCQSTRVLFKLKYLSSEIGFCNYVILLEMNNFINCYEISPLFYQSSIYFVNIFAEFNFTQLEKCLYNSTSAEVIVFSNSSIFQLGPVFPIPRHLQPSSIAGVLQRRKEKFILDLQGTKVIVAFMHYPPFSIFTDRNKPETGDGIEFVIIQQLSRYLNFTVQHNLYKFWGNLHPNGTWYGDGLAQAMQERKADLAVANIWQIQSFLRVLDFGPTLNRNSGNMLVRRPVQIDFKWQVFMTIFQPPVWFCTFVSFIVVVVVYHKRLVADGGPGDHSWSVSALRVFGHATMTTSGPLVTSTRPLLTSWSVFSLLLMSSLSTGIVSRLTLPLFSPRLDTHQQLFQAGYIWTVQMYRNFHTSEVKNMMFDIDKPWSLKFEQRYVYMEKEQVEQEIQTNLKLAIPVQSYGDDFFIINTKGADDQRKLRDFRRTKSSSPGCHLSWGVKKYSPLRRPLTVMTQRFIQAGLPRQWKDQVIRRWPRYDISHTLVEQDIPVFSEPQPLTFKKTKPILYILGIGLIIASLVFFLELTLWSI